MIDDPRLWFAFAASLLAVILIGDEAAMNVALVATSIMCVANLANKSRAGGDKPC